MNFKVGIVDENGTIQKITINNKFFIELSERLRQEGVTPVLTSDDKGRMQTYNAQALIVMAKDTKGGLMFLPNIKD
jgi:hypothetical protein